MDRSSAAGARAIPMSLRSGAARGPRPFTRWQRAAHALAVENSAPPCRVAQPDRCGGIEVSADEGDGPGELGRLQLERRHARGRAVRDDVREILVGGRAAEQAAAEVDAGNLVAIPPVTLDAVRAVNPVARGDVFLAVLSGVILVEQWLRARRDGHYYGRPHHKRDQRRAPHGHSTLYTSPAAKSSCVSWYAPSGELER